MLYKTDIQVPNPNQVPNPTPTQYRSWLELGWNWAKTELGEFYTQSLFFVSK